MARFRHEGLWRPARDIPFLVLSAAVVLSLVRSVSLPSTNVAVGGADVSLTPADIAFAGLAVVCVLQLLGRGSLPRPARAVAYAAAAFSAWLLISSAVSGFDAFVGAAKLLEYGLVGLGVVLVVRRRTQLWLLVWLLVALTVSASAYALLGFFDLAPVIGNAGKRQPSFLGEHDYAALSTLALTAALASLYAPRRRAGRWALPAAVAGAVGVVLGSALAGLLGLYLAIAAIVGLAAAHRMVTRRAVALTALVALLVTGGVLGMRSGDLGSILRYVGIQSHEEEAGAYAASWSQRAIYVYVGGRMFLSNPVAGVGWYGTIPSSEYERYLPDAYERFPGQPRSYFPPPDGRFVPQQTYDQVLYELGAVGALLFLLLGGATVRTAVGVGRSWPGDDADATLAYVPAAWTAALAGGLAGSALFGGIPFAAVFWLTLGTAALGPSLVPVQALLPQRSEPLKLPATAL